MKLTDKQEKALDIIKGLVKEGRLNIDVALELVTIIYDLTPDAPVITVAPNPDPQPYQVSPWTNPWSPTTWPNTTSTPLPWWEQNKIWCTSPDYNTATSTSHQNTYAYNKGN